MNKKYKQYVPFVFIAAVVLFGVILFSFLKEPFGDLQEQKIKNAKAGVDLQKSESEIKKLEDAQALEQMKFQSLKRIYESDVPSSNENLGLFGSMFDDIITLAQKDGLLIRSIEYNLRPESDPLYSQNADAYNVCELKFFFVGKYTQLLSFLKDVNNSIEYLIYLSDLRVSAFSENPDYLIIKTSITLYSVKSDAKQNKKSKK